MLAARAASREILHLYYRDIVAAPLQTVARLYRHCGLTLSPTAEQRMHEYVRRTPRGGYGVHAHSLAEFGLEPRLLRDQFARYVNTFDVPVERIREPARGVFTARPA